MKSPFLKILSCWLILSLLAPMVVPTAAYALTGGPSQPEVQSFEPFNTTQMVDNFTGDLTYNIPLLDVGGYPVNLSYHSGINMDQEATWVGLGWNINPGTINRSMRGLPDDFNGDVIHQQQYTKPNETYGGALNLNVEIFGIETGKIARLFKTSGQGRKALSLNLGLGLGLKYNNYRGMAADFSISPSLSANFGAKSGLNIGLGLNSSTDNGVGFEPGISYSYTATKTKKGEGDCLDTGTSSGFGLSFGASINSRGGLKQLSYGASMKAGKFISYENSEGKKEVESLGQDEMGVHGSYTFASPSYSPSGDFSYQTYGFSMNGTFGTEIFGQDASVRLSGHYSKQSLQSETLNQGAYGLMYLQKAYDSDEAVMDFNREKEGAFIPSKPNLPVTQLTGDIYGVTGQGVSGSYLPFRGEVGIVGDAKSTTSSDDGSLGIEFGGGNLVRTGGNLAYSRFRGETGRWKDDNPFASDYRFKDWDRNNLQFEPYYFKAAGEGSVVESNDPYHTFGGEEAIRVELSGNRKAEKKFRQGNQDLSAPVNNVRPARDRRNQTIQVLTASEASRWGLQKKIPYYKVGDATRYEMERTSNSRKGHHISEIIVTRADGSRYVYGIAAYNHLQKEATFNIARNGISVDRCTETVSYDPNSDATTGNRNGVDHFYSQKSTPGYAYAYLLTAVLSPDYVDLTGDGPSEDDLGTATWFNYFQTSSENQPFQWRTPTSNNENVALLNEGLLSDPTDDKASYVYGTKEMWYLHSIETKTHKAYFHISPKADGRGVSGEHGKVDANQKTYKLDSLELYARRQQVNGTSVADFPLKTVHLEYDYSLCSGTTNSDSSGKLCLKKVYFTHGNTSATRGQLNAYQFGYSGQNPGYHLKATDRWGDYKPQGCEAIFGQSRQGNSYFPYTAQGDSAAAAQNTSAWCLTDIKLPSGGKIKVTYEADDYAYVQDRKAMMMMKVVGATDVPNALPGVNDGNKLYDPGQSGKKYLIFELHPKHQIGSINDYLIQQQYIGDIRWMYFKFLVRTGKDFQDGREVHDYVSGYARIEKESCGTFKDATSGKNYGFVKLKTVSFAERNADGDMHPITKAAINFGQLVTPKYLYKGYDTFGSNNDFVSAMEQIANSVTQIGELFTGLQSKFLNAEFGRQFDPPHSYIRLYHPTGQKFGGGLRVKMIATTDRWKDMTGDAAAETTTYGYEYDYGMEEGGRRISSGVATYEPMMGNDENPWRQIIGPYGQNNPLAADGEQFMETPMGESFFPSPSVGYRRITVRPFGTSEIGSSSRVTKSGAGRMEYEFYTAKDFPIQLKQTDLKQVRQNNRPVMSLVKIGIRDKSAASQGYAIITNDMHGKPKSERSYAEGKSTPLSEKQFIYQTSGGKINTIVPTISRESAVINHLHLGQDVSVVLDMIESENETYGPGLDLNLDGFILPIIPPLFVPVPVPMPQMNTEVTGFRCAVVTKLVQQYGVLAKTIVIQDGAQITTENLLWDRETGAVLLTRTQNEFEDWVYHFSYPAHWAYAGMGLAYHNIGARIQISTGSDGTITGGTWGAFTAGDEIGSETGSFSRWWVAPARFDTTSSFKLIDRDGNPVANLSSAPGIILRSGRRNMAGTPIGTLTFLQNPIQGNTLITDFAKVLDAQATRFKEDWNIFCCNLATTAQVKCNDPCDGYNPYVQGRAGNWRAYKTYKYVSDRDFKHPVSNVRAGGTIQHFQPFWHQVQTEAYWKPPVNVDAANCRWVAGSEVTEVNQYGMELENKDALGRYSAALFGFNNTLPLAVAQNARYRELAYEGFEEGVGTSYQGHCAVRSHLGYEFEWYYRLSDSVAHTGKKSLRLPAGQKSAFFLKVDAPADPVSLIVPATIRESGDCIPTFRLDKDDNDSIGDNYNAARNRYKYRYSLSAWSQVRTTGATCPTNGSRIKVYALTDCKAIEIYSFAPSVQRIEGWHKIDGDFTVPNTIDESGTMKAVIGVKIELVPASGTTTYFDDLRIHPYHATMKSFAYDPKNLRVMAELDENNYATFYEYDESGALVRVKKETARGVMTIREHRSHATYLGQ